jgi:F-type H+-transporting ATPase subunit delta
MFHTDRWAAAFLTVSGENTESAFLCLKALSVPVKSIHGVFVGHSAAAELEKILRESANVSKVEISPSVEYAIRFICLLVEKKSFKYIDVLLQRIEQKLDEQKGFLDLSLEAAAPLDSGFEKELAQMIKEKTGASEVKMKTSVKPELLAGFLIRIGGFYVDASLKGQVEAMKADLIKVAV